MKAKLIIDDFEQVVKYKSPESTRKGRVKSTELLGNGGRHFHVPGVSNEYSVKFTTYILQEDLEQINHFDLTVYNNDKVYLVSTFNNVQTGYYYLTDFNLKYEDTLYYSVDWELNKITINDSVSSIYGSSNDLGALSTSTSLNTDNNSVTSTSNTLTSSNTSKTQVKQLQRLLKLKGFYIHVSGSSLVVDGVWGKYMTQAIQQYQKKTGLTVTGTVTAETKKALGY